MPLKKFLPKAGVNRENTRYTNEGSWYECDKVRFRQGTPEKIGGWVRISSNTFLGLCRSLCNWVTLAGLNLLGVGTSLKFYIERGGVYYDVTPIRVTNVLTDPFTTSNGSPNVTVTDASGGFITGDFVTFSGATAVGGLTLNGEYQITALTSTTYRITAASNASATTTGGGTVTAAYQINVGPATEVAAVGWGSGSWSSNGWGIGNINPVPVATPETLRIWSQANFGEDLIYGPRGGALYYWTASSGDGVRGVLLSSLSGAASVPLTQNYMLVSDASRFVFVFGSNDYLSTELNPMLVRWSDQESAVNWVPSATNQSGSLTLSHGSKIVTALQSRQEILIWTDSSVYGLQYVGAPVVWASQLLGDNISIVGQGAAVIASGVAYWMGVDKFYKYDGRVQTLRCDLRQFVYGDINLDQAEQFFSGSNEGFNEVWFFYCSITGPTGTGTPGDPNTTVDRYVTYNYAEDVWTYGNLSRTAWLDSGLRRYPCAATYLNNIVDHEVGVDNIETSTTQPISAYITSAEFDIDDGDRFSFIWRVLPDMTFRGSSAVSPQATLTLYPLANSGSGYNNPLAVGGQAFGAITRGVSVPIEEFTGQLNIRVRGRQLAFKIESTEVGTTWQMGAMRLDIRPDGRA